MQNNFDAVGYSVRKGDLEVVLIEREKLSKELYKLVQAGMFSSSMGGIIRLDVQKAQEILGQLSAMETVVEDLVGDINTYAEKIGRTPVKLESRNT